ncbi:MAG: hypothetical protein AB1894_25635 [Chloroflexota bacterium]
MSDYQSTFLKTAGIICLAVFVLSVVVLLPAINAANLFFDADFYKQALRQQDAYARFPKLASEQIMSALRSGTLSGGQGGQNPGSLPFVKNMKQSDWETIVSGLVPTEWLQTQVEGLIDGFFGYLNSDAPALEMKLSMAEVKNRVRGEPGWQAILQVLKAQPPCDFLDLFDLFFGMLDEGLAGLPSCRPPADLINEFKPDIQQALGEMVDGVPDEFDAAAVVQDSLPAGSSLEDLRTGVRGLRALAYLGLLAPLGSLALATLLVVRSWQDWLVWWGLPLVIGGTAAFLLALATPTLATLLIVNWMVASMPAGLSQGLGLTLSSLSQALFETFATRVALQAVVIAFIGFLMAGIWLAARAAAEVQRRRLR